MEDNKWERSYPPEFPYDYAGMNLEKALMMIEAAKQKAQEMGFSMTIAVCDAAGNIVSLQRMDDAPLMSVEIAINKARTSVFGKIPTHQWGAIFKGTEPVIPPLRFHSGWIAFPGGFPVVVNGKVIGGLGCSGATWEDCLAVRAGLIKLHANTEELEEFLKSFGVPKEKW